MVALKPLHHNYMLTTDYLLAWHLAILYKIFSPSHTLLLSFNHFSLYSSFTIYNIFYFNSTFSFFFLHVSLTCPHFSFAIPYLLLETPPSHLYTCILSYYLPLSSYYLLLLIWKIFTKIKFSSFILTLIRITTLGNKKLSISPFNLYIWYTFLLVSLICCMIKPVLINIGNLIG